MQAKTKTLWTFAITSVALFMVVLDNLVVSTALPVIRTDLDATIEQLEWTVNAYTLTFAVFLLTGAALGDRFGRRRMFIIGLVLFTARLGGGGAGALDGGADRSARRPGDRRRDRHAADADDPVRRVPLREARHGARRVVGHRRPRSRGRPARRRRRRRRDRVAVDLLAERPDRARGDPAGADARRVPRPRQGARPARPRARERRPARPRLGPRARQLGRLEQPADRRLARRRRRPARRLRRLGGAGEGADAAAALLQGPGVLGRQRRLARDVLRHVRVDLPALAVLPDRAGLLALRGRAAGAAVDGDADGRRADRRCALRPDRRPALPRRRARPAGDRARLDRGRLRGRRRATRRSSGRSSSRGSGWACSSRPWRTSSSARSACATRARPPARRTRSARSAASSASRCSRRSSPASAATSRRRSSPRASSRRRGSAPRSSASAP